jgi:acetolactate synthase-1/2/3 large subunit
MEGRAGKRLHRITQQVSSLSAQRQHGGWLLVQSLLAHRVERVFCVPGESYLAVLDALHDVSSAVEVVVCRQEGGAAMMAEADGKLTGRPGVAMVTRAPGATNASAGVHIAFQDSTPMVLLVGQVGRGMVDREAFQEVDYRKMFGPGVGVAKACFQIDSPLRIPEYLNRAFALATSARPGPVVLALPEDVLSGYVDPAACPIPPPARGLHPVPSDDAIAELGDMLHHAQRPVILAGGGGFWGAESCDLLASWAMAWSMSVVASFRRQDTMDNRHPCYAGHLGIGPDPAVVELVAAADLLIVIGGRLGEMTSQGYTLVQIPHSTQQRLVHVHPDGDELNSVYTATLPIHATPRDFLGKLQVLLPCPAPAVSEPLVWAASTAAAHARYNVYCAPVAIPGAVQLTDIVAAMDAFLPADSIITNGAGNYASYAHRYYRYKAAQTQLAPTSGSMGYGESKPAT